jgi:hypothetical protein
MQNSLVVRCGLGAILAGAALPLTVRAQTPPVVTAPVASEAPAAPPAEAPTAAPTPAAESAPPAIAAPTLEPAAAADVGEVTPPPAEPAAAEEPGLAPPTINGYIEAAYHINFSNSKVSEAIPLRVYDPAGNSFALHAAHLALTQKFTDAISAVVEIDMGRDALANSGLVVYPWNNTKQFENQFGFDFQEAYANYSSGAFTLTAGKFVTYEGIEVMEGPLNPTISRGFLYGWAEAFTHTGIKLHYQPIPEFNIGVGVVNGWDLIADTNQGKTFIARIAAFAPTDVFFAALSGSVGPEQAGNSKNQRISVDLTGAITPSSAFQLWYQANVGTEKGVAIDGKSSALWYGFGLQPVVTTGDFSLGGRVEYFVDKNGARTGMADGKFFNFTITPGYKLASTFKVRAEFRADVASDKIFGKKDDLKKVGLTAVASAEYTF